MSTSTEEAILIPTEIDIVTPDTNKKAFKKKLLRILIIIGIIWVLLSILVVWVLWKILDLGNFRPENMTAHPEVTRSTVFQN